ncbi:MAG: DUF3892 domain-containing protein [Candidatus Aenigmarchaeota archaeon]|nr:DUF3892 domain-containing protein [Candidatus Aenigmarchaeota archaeon]
MRYQIICTTRKENDSIDKLGFIEEGKSEGKPTHIETKEAINQRIRSGDSFFFTDEAGKETEVIAVEDDYVKTSPDSTTKNNLLHLKKC